MFKTTPKTVLIGLLTAASLLAQHNTHSVPSPEKPVALFQNLGGYSHQIETANPEAQRFFDQGLRLLYGFNRYEALRSFRRAAELDPQAAMPLWGVAMALGPHINMDGDGDVKIEEACQTLSKATQLTVRGS